MMDFKFLSKDEPIEKTFNLVSRFCLVATGLYPSLTSRLFRNLRSVLNLVFCFLGVTAEFAYGFYYLQVDLYRGIHAICPAISCFVSFIKMCLIAWHGQKLASVLSRLEYVLVNEKKEENRKIIRQASAEANMFTFLTLVLASGTAAIYVIRPLVTNFYRISQGLNYIWDDMPLMILVPPVMLRLPWYLITYSFSSYVGFICIFSFTGVDGMFLSLCFYLGAILRVIQGEMLQVLQHFEDKHHMTMDEYRACCRTFGKVVDRHNKVIDLVKEFSNLYALIILAHFGTSAIVVGASVIEAMLYDGIRSLFYLSYTVAVTWELFVYCYGGNAILTNSSDLGVAVYSCRWYTYDVRVQKMVLMVIIRSQSPLNMAVPFFKPSFETFSSVIQTAGSIVTLVKSLVL